MDSTFFDKNGEEMTLEDFLFFADIDDYKRVASYTFRDGTWVSTVWLGINHQYNPDKPPLIFETMVFNSGSDGSLGEELEEFTERYSTLEDARLGHAIVIEQIREQLEKHEKQKQEIREQN